MGVGTYYHTCTAQSGYKFGNSNNTCVRPWTIKSASISCPSSTVTKTYTGGTISSGINCPTHSTLSSGGSGTGVGGYNQICVAQSGYLFGGTSSTCTIHWNIRAANCNFTCRCTCKDGSTQTGSSTLSGAYTCSNITSSNCTSICSSRCSSHQGVTSKSKTNCSCS